MPEETVVDEVVLTDEEKKAAADAAAVEAAEAAELEAGFTDAPTEVIPPVIVDEAAKAAEKEAADGVTAAAAANKPVYRQITEQEWTQVQSTAAAIDTLKTEHRKELDRAFGKVGGLERTLKTIQEATPAGHTVEVTDADVADLAKEFPELGGLVLKSLKSVAGKLKGTAPAAPAAPDPALIEATVQTRLIALQSEELEDARPNWRTITGTPEAKTPYRVWLATQPAEYQAKLASTNSAMVIARSLDKFEAAAASIAKDAAAAAEKAAAEAAKKAAADKRRGVIAAAVPPKGSTGHVPAGSADDDFEDGFKNG